MIQAKVALRSAKPRRRAVPDDLRATERGKIRGEPGGFFPVKTVIGSLVHRHSWQRRRQVICGFVLVKDEVYFPL
jgi:hypothetical protein